MTPKQLHSEMEKDVNYAQPLPVVYLKRALVHSQWKEHLLVKWYQLPAYELVMQLFYACNVQVLDTGTLYILYAHTFRTKQFYSELTLSPSKHSVLFVSLVNLHDWSPWISVLIPYDVWCSRSQFLVHRRVHMLKATPVRLLPCHFFTHVRIVVFLL